VALEQIGNTAGGGVAFIVSAGIVYEIVAANCSSPQTTELNASKRADTLMKWVNLGMVQAAFFVGAAALFDKAHAKPILAGGAAAGVFMYALYAHAKASGLANPGEPTEQHAS
jgi:hypothetical protein